jgi:hypothetical protein
MQLETKEMSPVEQSYFGSHIGRPINGRIQIVNGENTVFARGVEGEMILSDKITQRSTLVNVLNTAEVLPRDTLAVTRDIAFEHGLSDGELVSMYLIETDTFQLMMKRIMKYS